MLIAKATNTYFIIFGLIRPWLEPTIYRTRGGHANITQLMRLNVNILTNTTLNLSIIFTEKYKITCSSEDNQNTTCTDGRSMPASFYLDKEFSDGLCRNGVTFGPGSKIGPEIWVSGGCSATFRAYT